MKAIGRTADNAERIEKRDGRIGKGSDWPKPGESGAIQVK
jgi:hypothetical protein